MDKCMWISCQTPRKRHLGLSSLKARQGFYCLDIKPRTSRQHTHTSTTRLESPRVLRLGSETILRSVARASPALAVRLRALSAALLGAKVVHSLSFSKLTLSVFAGVDGPLSCVCVPVNGSTTSKNAAFQGARFGVARHVR